MKWKCWALAALLFCDKLADSGFGGLGTTEPCYQPWVFKQPIWWLMSTLLIWHQFHKSLDCVRFRTTLVSFHESTGVLTSVFPARDIMDAQFLQEWARNAFSFNENQCSWLPRADFMEDKALINCVVDMDFWVQSLLVSVTNAFMCLSPPSLKEKAVAAFCWYR